MEKQEYSAWIFLANTNTNIFGLSFLPEYKYKYIWRNISPPNTTTNIFGLIFFGEYKYKFIWAIKKGRIQIRIYGLIFTNTKKNMNIGHTLPSDFLHRKKSFHIQGRGRVSLLCGFCCDCSGYWTGRMTCHRRSR